jgi:hypothetical protein
MKKHSFLSTLFIIMLPFVSFDQERTSGLSEHIYQLPFEKGKNVLLMQGYNGTFSHKNKYALDFRLRKGKKDLRG